MCLKGYENTTFLIMSSNMLADNDDSSLQPSSLHEATAGSGEH